MEDMVAVKVFYDGTYSVQEARSNMAVQHLYIGEKGKFGEAYICPKEEIEKYKNKLIHSMIEKHNREIIDLQNKNKGLEKLLLTNID